TVMFKTASGMPVRTLTGSGASATVSWDGRNDSNVLQSDDTYYFNVESLASGGTASPLRGTAILNSSLAFTLSNVSVSEPYFSPNGDSVKDTTAVSASCSFDGPAWTVNVKNASGTTVRSFNSTGPALSFPWDGKDMGGTL